MCYCDSGGRTPGVVLGNLGSAEWVVTEVDAIVEAN